MKTKKLHTDFEKAVGFVNTYAEPLPADLLLKLYAYYKIANRNYDNPASDTPLINAFKANALIQAKKMGREEAMREYVKLVRNEVMKGK